MAKRKFTWRIFDEDAPHWSDQITIASDNRGRRALRCFFPTEAALRAAWPLQPGEIPNLGKKSIDAIGDALNLPLAEPRNPPPLSLSPRLARFSDYDLRRELAARQKFGLPRLRG